MKEAIILLHGFRGNPNDVKNLEKEIVRKNKKVDVYTPLMLGHSFEVREIKRGTKYTEIVDDLVSYLREIKCKHEKLTLIGYSMGALVSMAAVMQENVDKLVLINAPIYIWSTTSFEHLLIKDIKVGRIKNLKTVLSTFDYRVIRFSFELRKLRKFVRDNISKIDCDTLIIQSIFDYVARPNSGQYIYENIASIKKEIYKYEEDHFIPDSENLDKIVNDINNWYN